jgi:putative oxidoreductase
MEAHRMNNAWILLVGRVLFSLFFLMSGYNHLTKTSMMAQYAGSQGMPAPTLAVAVSGVMLLAGGLSFLLGYQVRWGALLLVVFLVTAAVTMHKFWGVADPMMAQGQFINFWKNIVIAGATLIIYYYATLHPEPWPYSLGK